MHIALLRALYYPRRAPALRGTTADQLCVRMSSAAAQVRGADTVVGRLCRDSQSALQCVRRPTVARAFIFSASSYFGRCAKLAHTCSCSSARPVSGWHMSGSYVSPCPPSDIVLGTGRRMLRFSLGCARSRCARRTSKAPPTRGPTSAHALATRRAHRPLSAACMHTGLPMEAMVAAKATLSRRAASRASGTSTSNNCQSTLCVLFELRSHACGGRAYVQYRLIARAVACDRLSVVASGRGPAALYPYICRRRRSRSCYAHVQVARNAD